MYVSVSVRLYLFLFPHLTVSNSQYPGNYDLIADGDVPRYSDDEIVKMSNCSDVRWYCDFLNTIRIMTCPGHVM